MNRPVVIGQLPQWKNSMDFLSLVIKIGFCIAKKINLSNIHFEFETVEAKFESF